MMLLQLSHFFLPFIPLCHEPPPHPRHLLPWNVFKSVILSTLSWAWNTYKGRAIFSGEKMTDYLLFNISAPVAS